MRPVAGEKHPRVSFLRGDMHLMALRAAFALLVRLREKHERREDGHDPFNERSEADGSLGRTSSPIMETLLSIMASESAWPSVGWSTATTSFRSWAATNDIVRRSA